MGSVVLLRLGLNNGGSSSDRADGMLGMDGLAIRPPLQQHQQQQQLRVWMDAAWQYHPWQSGSLCSAHERKWRNLAGNKKIWASVIRRATVCRRDVLIVSGSIDFQSIGYKLQNRLPYVIDVLRLHADKIMSANNPGIDLFLADLFNKIKWYCINNSNILAC